MSINQVAEITQKELLERWKLKFVLFLLWNVSFTIPLASQIHRFSPTSHSSCTNGSSLKNPWEIQFVIFLSSLPNYLSSKIQTAMQCNSIPWGEHFLCLVLNVLLKIIIYDKFTSTICACVLASRMVGLGACTQSLDPGPSLMTVWVLTLRPRPARLPSVCHSHAHQSVSHRNGMWNGSECSRP